MRYREPLFLPPLSLRAMPRPVKRSASNLLLGEVFLQVLLRPPPADSILLRRLHVRIAHRGPTRARKLLPQPILLTRPRHLIFMPQALLRFRCSLSIVARVKGHACFEALFAAFGPGQVLILCVKMKYSRPWARPIGLCYGQDEIAAPVRAHQNQKPKRC